MRVMSLAPTTQWTPVLLALTLTLFGCGDSGGSGDTDGSVSGPGRPGAPCRAAGDCEAGLLCVPAALQGACASYCASRCGSLVCPPEIPVCDTTYNICRPASCESVGEVCNDTGYVCRAAVGPSLDSAYCVPDQDCFE